MSLGELLLPIVEREKGAVSRLQSGASLKMVMSHLGAASGQGERGIVCMVRHRCPTGTASEPTWKEIHSGDNRFWSVGIARDGSALGANTNPWKRSRPYALLPSGTRVSALPTQARHHSDHACSLARLVGWFTNRRAEAQAARPVRASLAALAFGRPSSHQHGRNHNAASNNFQLQHAPASEVLLVSI